MLAAAAFALFLAGAQTTEAAPCAYDRAAMLALDQQAFDQDMDGGWRALSARPGCKAAAADLIRDYREAHRSEATILYWHEGQLRAEDGQTAQAIALFERARKAEDPFGWNHYVDASIAFLRRDRPALIAAREALAALPLPADYAPRDIAGRPVEVRWPPNLAVVDGLIACFGHSYRDAYAQRCGPFPAAN